MFKKLKEVIFTNYIGGEFQKNYKNHIFQSSLLFVCVSFALLLDNLFGEIIVASLGASGFILFVTPHANSSRSRNIIGGYVCGAIGGILFGLLHNQVTGFSFPGVSYALIFICAAASAFTTFLMVTTNMAHPPAAALALGLSADPECIKTAIAAIIGVIILCIARRILKKYLKNLI